MENNMPPITSTEIKEWEQKFMEQVTQSVQFDKKSNGYSMQVFNGPGGRDTNWAGTIMTGGGDDYIKWTFSIKNDPFIEAKLKLTDESSKLLTSLFNFYLTWKDDWGKQMSIDPQQDVDLVTNGGPEAAPGMPVGGAAPDMAMSGGMGQTKASMAGAINERRQKAKDGRTKESIITTQKDRMLRLAQLLK